MALHGPLREWLQFSKARQRLLFRNSDLLESHNAGFAFIGFNQLLLPFLPELVRDDFLIILYEYLIAVWVVPGSGIICRLYLRYFLIAVIAGLPFKLVDSVESHHEQES